LRACGARPSAGGTIQGSMASRGKPGDDGKGDFLGGARSPRPRIRARRKPGHVTLTDGSARGWWPKRGDIRFSAMPSFRACGARPSAKSPSDAKKALRRKPGDDGKGGFLGGTHSVRPRGTAERMPRHFFPTTCVEDCPGAHQSRASVKPMPPSRACGARPSAGGQAGVRDLAGKARK
jgi:hypothetical protein